MKTCLTFGMLVASAATFAQAPPSLPVTQGPDRVQVVTAGEMPVPLPSPTKTDNGNDRFATAADGVSHLISSTDKVSQFYRDIAVAKSPPSTLDDANKFAGDLDSGRDLPKAPVHVTKLSALKLTFEPTEARSGTLVSAAPQGTIVNGAWTGVERYYLLENAGIYRISEFDMAASKGMFYMDKGAVNTSVGGKPAIAAIFADSDNRWIEEVLWVSGTRLYTVTFAPSFQTMRNGLRKENSSVSALSLATALP